MNEEGSTSLSKREQWCAHLERWNGSALSMRAFCRQEGLSVNSLKYWRDRLTEPQGKPAVVRLSVRPSRALGVIEVVVADRFAVRITEGFSLEHLGPGGNGARVIVMTLDWAKVTIYVVPGPTDMRKEINGLSVLVQEQLGIDVFGANVILFCNRRRSHLKALFWDRNGFWLALKRLERDRFPWPRDAGQVQSISSEQLRMLLDGIDFWKAHQPLDFSRVS